MTGLELSGCGDKKRVKIRNKQHVTFLVHILIFHILSLHLYFMTDGQTDKQAYRQTYRQTDRQIDRQTGRQTDRHRQTDTDRQTHKQTDR